MTSPEPGTLVEAEVDRVLTQYRESPKLLAMIRAYLADVEAAALAICVTPDAFDIDTATGDQLTIIGKWLGWPREHCRGARNAAFGFEKAGCVACEQDDDPIVGGFCSDWGGCAGSDYRAYTFLDDDLYRRFLKARAVQLAGDFHRETLTAAIRALFGASTAMIVRERPGAVTVTLGRPIKPGERQILHLYRDVLPIAPGIKPAIKGHGFAAAYEPKRIVPEETARTTTDGDFRVLVENESETFDIYTKPFGFGGGLGGFCDGQWIN